MLVNARQFLRDSLDLVYGKVLLKQVICVHIDDVKHKKFPVHSAHGNTSPLILPWSRGNMEDQSQH